jgi:kinesin family protein 13
MPSPVPVPLRFTQGPPVQHQHQQFSQQQQQHHHQHTTNFQQQQPQFSDQNVFRGGGLIEQTAPNLATATPALHHQQLKLPEQHPPASFQRPQTHSNSFNHGQNLQSVQGLIPNSEVSLQNSEVRFEHHITETINSPVQYQTHSINMDLSKPKEEQKNQHRFTSIQGQGHGQNQGQGGVSNLYTDVFPQQQRNEPKPGSFLQVDPRNNFQGSPTASTVFSSSRPTTVSTSRAPSTVAPPPTTTNSPIGSNVILPDEVPDDLRQQLIDSGILANAHISILDYDKIGETSLDQLPPEHLANFFSAGGGSQIASSNRIVSVVKPNGDSIDEKIKAIKSDPEISKILENAKKLPANKEDVNLKVVRFNADNEKSVSDQYIKQDSMILPSVNINQNYNRYLPLKINGAQFPIPDAEELKGKKISSVVVLAPVDNQLNSNEDGRAERELIDTKSIEFVAGDVLKQLLKKPSSENYKRWLEKESKTEADLQSVVLLVTK